MKHSHLWLTLFISFILGEIPASAQMPTPPVGPSGCVSGCGGESGGSGSGSSGGHHGGGGGSGSSSSRPNPGRKAFQRGEELFDRAQWADAENAYRETLNYWPNNSTVKVDLGRALYNQRKYEEAEFWFRRAIDDIPKITDRKEQREVYNRCYYSLGIALFVQQKYEQALDSQRAVLNAGFKPGDDTDAFNKAWGVAGAAQWYLGYYSNAKSLLEVAVERDPRDTFARASYDSMRREMANAATGFNEAAADLTNILTDAAVNMRVKGKIPKPGPITNRKQTSLNCQSYFRTVAAELAKNNHPSWANDFNGPDADRADKIAGLIAKEAETKQKWEQIEGYTPEEIYRQAQRFANRGAIVVGAMPKEDKRGYGHLGFVAPIREGLDVSLFAGAGPFVRDGNEHLPGGKLFASTWGAIKASNAFVLANTKWYVWVPSKR